MIGNKQQILSFLQDKDESDIFEIVKKQEKSLRSLAQNKFYWSIVIDIIWNFHWFTPVETHLMLKKTFNIDTTTELTTSEFKTLIEMIQDVWVNKFNVIIPNPSDLKDEESLYKTLNF